MSGRYFTVTGDRWMTQPDSVMLLDWPALERLAQLIPPARSAGKAYGKTTVPTIPEAVSPFARVPRCGAPARPSLKWSPHCVPIPKLPLGFAKKATPQAVASCPASGNVLEPQSKFSAD